jgi:tripartite-type tricarboxylate transporter receptor subunit TctC
MHDRSSAPGRPNRRALIGLGLGAGLVLPGLARAQQQRPGGGGGWPERPVTLLVGFPPGGQTDLAARVLQAPLSAALGQPVPIDNRGGAGGNIATEQVLRARPDGYTLLVGNVGTFVLNPHTMPSMGFDPLELTPIGVMLSSPLVLAVHSSVPVRNFAEWREWVQREQARGGIDMATTSAGGAVHAASERLRGLIGNPTINLIHYRGSGPAHQDFLGGRFPTMLDAPSLLHPFVQPGQIRPILVTSTRPNPAYPGVPTSAEAGIPDFLFGGWIGLFGPRGLPADIVARASAALDEACRDPVARERFASRGDEIGGGVSPADFAAQIRREHAEWGAVVRAANIRAE